MTSAVGFSGQRQVHTRARLPMQQRAPPQAFTVSCYAVCSASLLPLDIGMWHTTLMDGTRTTFAWNDVQEGACLGLSPTGARYDVSVGPIRMSDQRTSLQKARISVFGVPREWPHSEVPGVFFFLLSEWLDPGVQGVFIFPPIRQRRLCSYRWGRRWMPWVAQCAAGTACDWRLGRPAGARTISAPARGLGLSRREGSVVGGGGCGHSR